MPQTQQTRREFVRDGALTAAGLAVGLSATYTVQAGNPQRADTGKILNYNPDMEYRRCGKTNLMISAVALGGHWKRVNVVLPCKTRGKSWVGGGAAGAVVDAARFAKGEALRTDPAFDRNRRDVVSRCIERGINYVDACMGTEVLAYAKALKGRRDKMYLGYSWHAHEMRFAGYRTLAKLKQSLDAGLKEAGLDYIDLWRITCYEQSGMHSEAEIDVLVRTLEWAKQSGRVRFTGISSHDRPHIKKLIEKYPKQLEVICTPYTAKTKIVEDQSGLWAAMKKLDVGWFGIKPFASNSVFQGDSSPGSPYAEADSRLARQVIRYILANPAITAPIPGLITPEQVDNVCLAVKERRQLDAGEKAELDRAMDRAWASLPSHYQFLKDWEYV